MKHIIKEIITITISLILIITGMILKNILYDTQATQTILTIIFGLGFIIGGFYSLIEGIKETIEHKSLNVHLLMIIAAIGAFFIGDYEEGAVLIFIFGLAGILEEYATLKSEKAFTDLLTLAPNKATKIVGGIEEEVDVETLQVGEEITVKMGEQIPVDGIITNGFTSVDEKMITGEFVYKDKKEGDLVYAGTINMKSNIIVKVEKDPKETVVQKIVDFVEDAQNSKTKSQTLITKIEKWYVYGVIALALIVMFVLPQFNIWTKEEALIKGIIVLVVASPCALVASITPAILSSLSRSSKEGILVKGGEPFEHLRQIDVAVFDKTGTITQGLPKVEYFKTYNIEESLFLKALISIERQSTHPLAKAIVDHFPNVVPMTLQAIEKPGIGLSASIDGEEFLIGRFEVSMCNTCQKEMTEATEAGYTIVQVAKDNKMVGFVALKDIVREDAKETIENLNNQNIKTHLLTGDNYKTAKAISDELGFQSFRSDCLPDEKVEEVQSLKAKGQTVLMVGDGVNDAPSLIESDVGIAMGSATDISLEAADVVFVNNKLSNIKDLIKRSKKLHRIVIQNIVFSILIIAVLLFLNLFSNINITLGVIFHEGSTIVVILNSLRLLFKK